MCCALLVLVWTSSSRLGLVTAVIATVALVVAMVQIAALHGQRAAASAEARRAHELRSALSAAALDCVITIDHRNRIREWNRAAERTFGYARAAALGSDLAELTVPPEFRARHRRGLASLLEGRHLPILDRPTELTAIRADGTRFPVEISVNRVDTEPPMFTAYLRDITERRRREEENARLAAIVRSSEEAMLSKTLDGVVTAWNDAATKLYGYTAEEAIGSRISDLIVPSSRAGEWERITRQVVELGPQVLETTRRRKDGRRIEIALRAFPIEDPSGAIVGVSAIARDITERKRQQEDRERDREASLWRSRLQAAIDQDRLLFHAQPVLDIATGEIDHHELLLRMRLEGELMAPGRFLPYAEDTDLIGRIDQWALVRGISIARRLPVAINLSAKSIGNFELIDWIKRRLADTRSDPAGITFEITETAVADNLEAARFLMEELSGLGCGVALDDFGTGYSSFTYLKHLPVTELKIDVEFVRNLVDSPSDRRVVQSLVSVARNFGIRTVAEGVEEPRTLGVLRTLGVDLAQGYLLGRPQDLSQVTQATSKAPGIGHARIRGATRESPQRARFATEKSN
jgi:PAS domain S-box-containing protein